ncbi:MAG: hypothetical protein COB08_007390 [Rhodobacteraceae bacterium]|nr:hypothetical protein [Paracoccaceae bacterium]
MRDPKIGENLSQDELQAIMYFSHSLSNWAYVASRLVEASELDKKYVWNLNCVGEQGIPLTAYLEVERPAGGFQVSGTDLLILGDFEAGFYEELRDTLKANPNIQRVVLGSGGGSVSDAMQSGILIREKGLATTLSDNCFSACPLVFIGGIQRTIWSPYPNLGFHQIYTGEGQAIPFDNQVYILVWGYVDAMGADANFVLNQMLGASPSEMNEPSLDLLCERNVATWVQRICFGPSFRSAR